MRTKCLNAMGLCVMLICASTGEASKWKALREGVEALTKKSGKLLHEGAEEAAKRSQVRKALLEGLETGAGKAGSRIGGAVARHGAKDAGVLAARFGEHVAGPVVAKFGDDGARALGSLSTQGAARLAAMTDDLAASGRGRDWMQLIAQRGDGVMEWLWKRRGSVAVGTIATAVLLQPEEFLRASEHVATSTIHAAGEHVLRPLVAEGVEHIGAPIAARAAAAFPWRTVWTVAFMALIGVLLWRRFSPWAQV